MIKTLINYHELKDHESDRLQIVCYERVEKKNKNKMVFCLNQLLHILQKNDANHLLNLLLNYQI